jgi:hypothetical protein
MGSFFHLFCATDLGDMSEAGGALADAWRQTDGFLIPPIRRLKNFVP